MGTVALVAVQGGAALWSAETEAGRIARLLRTGENTTEAVERLQRLVERHPRFTHAHHILGSTLILGEQRRIARDQSVAGVDLDTLDRAAAHLDNAARVGMFPHSSLITLGQGFLFGARLSKDAQNREWVRPFAERARQLLLRGLALNPAPHRQPTDLWIEAAEAASMAGRPDDVLFALARTEEFTVRPDPNLARRVPELTRRAAIDLANAPLLTTFLYRRWRASPDDRPTWTLMAAVRSIPGGETAGATLLRHLEDSRPDDPDVRSLLRAAGLEPKPQTETPDEQETET